MIKKITTASQERISTHVHVIEETMKAHLNSILRLCIPNGETLRIDDESSYWLVLHIITPLSIQRKSENEFIYTFMEEDTELCEIGKKVKNTNNMDVYEIIALLKYMAMYDSLYQTSNE